MIYWPLLAATAAWCVAGVAHWGKGRLAASVACFIAGAVCAVIARFSL